MDISHHGVIAWLSLARLADGGLPPGSCGTGEWRGVLNNDVEAAVRAASRRLTTAVALVLFHHSEAPHRSAGLGTRYTAVRTPTGWRLAQAQIFPLCQRVSWSLRIQRWPSAAAT
ncbi:hypothetical protein AB0880_29010 [Micromonospora chersina]|uniref:hypothetical protein n=1 Tax=Micromonospora chersina TaxID=47854 RepID=UPI003455421C